MSNTTLFCAIVFIIALCIMWLDTRSAQDYRMIEHKHWILSRGLENQDLECKNNNTLACMQILKVLVMEEITRIDERPFRYGDY